MVKPDTGQEYTVEWAIEVYADTPEEAAMEAERIMQDPTNMANVFDVQPFGKPGEKVQVDLEQVRHPD